MFSSVTLELSKLKRHAGAISQFVTFVYLSCLESALDFKISLHWSIGKIYDTDLTGQTSTFCGVASGCLSANLDPEDYHIRKVRKTLYQPILSNCIISQLDHQLNNSGL
jgi:hypothetical protein